jgi:multidrug efflux system outer membrane protein
MTRPLPLSYALAALGLIATSCTVGPWHRPPDAAAQLGGKYKNAAGKVSAAAAKGPWWRSFHDSGLNSLEQEVLAGNQELAQARARIIASRAAVRQSRSSSFPAASVEAELPGAGSSNLTKSGASSRDLSAALGSYPLLLDISYEVDLWGRLKREREATSAEAEAVALDAENARLFLTVEAARVYYLYRAFEQQMAIAHEVTGMEARYLDLLKIRRKEGVTTGLEITRQQAALAKAQAGTANLQRDMDQAFNSLAELSGKPPSSFDMPQAGRDFLSGLPDIPAGLPADLLNRRADIASAERQLCARNAEIGVAIAASLPTISLTGQGGAIGSDLGKILSASNRFWLIGPSVSAPLLDGGKNRENVKIAEARHEEQIAAYRQSILTAVREVEDSLSAVRASRSRNAASAAAWRAADQAYEHAKTERQSGLSDQTTILAAEGLRLAESQSRIESQADCYAANLQLIKAIGGGWK